MNTDHLTINAAVKRAMADWLANGTTNIDTMRESIQWLVDEAIEEFQIEHVECTTDEEEDHA